MIWELVNSPKTKSLVQPTDLCMCAHTHMGTHIHTHTQFFKVIKV